MGNILYLHTVPEVGGDTIFSSMYAAYDALSAPMKAYLEGMSAVHDGEPVYRPIVNDPSKKFPCSTHPVVRTHPVTGKKCLFVNQSYTTHIVGVPKEESAAILNYLFLHCTNPNFQVRFRWTPRAVAFWDNRCTQHLAVWDYFPNTPLGLPRDGCGRQTAIDEAGSPRRRVRRFCHGPGLQAMTDGADGGGLRRSAGFQPASYCSNPPCGLEARAPARKPTAPKALSCPPFRAVANSLVSGNLTGNDSFHTKRDMQKMPTARRVFEIPTKAVETGNRE